MLATSRVAWRVPGVAGLALLLMFEVLPANADDLRARALLERPETAFLSGLQGCGHAFNDGMSEGSQCLLDWSANRLLLDALTRFATEQGRTAFGEHFRIVNDLTYSSYGSGLSGGLDVVLPLPDLTPRDINVVVTLAPGTGDNPAVPGVDYVDAPIPVTVYARTSSSVVTVRLPLNADLKENRSLRATVTLAS